jgi:hypothetical protein
MGNGTHVDAFAQLALMVKMERVFASEGTFLSFPALTPLTYPPERLRFAAPGETSAQALSDLADFSRITNRVPRGVLATVDDEEHLWDVYDDVLRSAQVAQGTMSPEDSRAYDVAMDVLYVRSPEGLRRDSEMLSQYKRCRDAHIAAQEAYKAAHVTAFASVDPAIQAEWSTVEPALRAEVDRLDEQWRLQGHKAAVESAQQVEERSAAHSPGPTWTEWRSSFIADLDLNTDTRTVQYAVTGFSPYDLFDRGTWPSFTLSHAEMTNLAAQAPPELSALFGGSSGSNIDSVTFEYRSVGLVRPWLRTALFRARYWRLAGEDSQLSDGNDPPTGRCPAYITALVFARNIAIKPKESPTQPPSTTESPGRLLQLQPDALVRLHLDRPDLIAQEQRDAASTLRKGPWNFKQVFSGGEGVIYAVADNGDLLWYRHDGRGDGSSAWAGEGRKVGSGWNFKQVFSGGEGVIYAVTDNGDLLWYRHDGRGDGSSAWAGEGRKVSSGSLSLAVSASLLASLPAARSDREQALSQAKAKIRLSEHSFASLVFHREAFEPLFPPLAPLPPRPDAVLPAEPPAAVSDDITVLAFICKRLPRCPDPDPSLEWP